MNDSITKPRVVDSIPKSRRGRKNNTDYDEIFDLAVDSYPKSIVAVEGVPAHVAQLVRQAMRVRLQRPQARWVTGSFAVDSRGVGNDLVDVFVTYVDEPRA